MKLPRNTQLAGAVFGVGITFLVLGIGIAGSTLLTMPAAAVVLAMLQMKTLT